jgi:cyclophilin family peptidyl-prolyl cis-trans isomerase
MKNNLDILQKDKIKLDFLAKQLEGVTATINTSEGPISLEFYPQKAPIHVFNFITRAESGFYDGTTFHRVIEGFMIQGGDPNSKDNNPNNDGQGGPIANIPHEFNDIKHEPGILSMARISNVNAGAGSQFFIMHGTSPNLDGQYTVFGKVTDGMEVVNKIAKTQKDNRDRPLK